MLLIYVDDILCVSHNPKPVMDEIGKLYVQWRKKVLVFQSIILVQILWSFVTRWKRIMVYVKFSVCSKWVKIVEGLLAQEGMKLKGKAERPYPQHYRPEVDVSQELEPSSQQYQQLIGILSWAVELGHVNIITEVSFVISSQCYAMWRSFETVYHTVSLHIWGSMNVQELYWWSNDWCQWTKFCEGRLKDFYGMKEAITPNRSLDNYVQVSTLIDANHAGNLVTCWSQTGILIFVNKALVMWYVSNKIQWRYLHLGANLWQCKLGQKWLRLYLQVTNVWSTDWWT